MLSSVTEQDLFAVQATNWFGMTAGAAGVVGFPGMGGRQRVVPLDWKLIGESVRELVHHKQEPSRRTLTT